MGNEDHIKDKLVPRVQELFNKLAGGKDGPEFKIDWDSINTSPNAERVIDALFAFEGYFAIGLIESVFQQLVDDCPDKDEAASRLKKNIKKVIVRNWNPARDEPPKAKEGGEGGSSEDGAAAAPAPAPKSAVDMQNELVWFDADEKELNVAGRWHTGPGGGFARDRLLKVAGAASRIAVLKLVASIKDQAIPRAQESIDRYFKEAKIETGIPQVGVNWKSFEAAGENETDALTHVERYRGYYSFNCITSSMHSFMWRYSPRWQSDESKQRFPMLLASVLSNGIELAWGLKNEFELIDGKLLVYGRWHEDDAPGLWDVFEVYEQLADLEDLNQGNASEERKLEALDRVGRGRVLRGGDASLFRMTLNHPAFGLCPNKEDLVAIRTLAKEYIPESEMFIYGFNANKVNYVGHYQERLILISNEAIYTFAYDYKKGEADKKRRHRHSFEQYHQTYTAEIEGDGIMAKIPALKEIFGDTTPHVVHVMFNQPWSKGDSSYTRPTNSELRKQGKDPKDGYKGAPAKESKLAAKKAEMKRKIAKAVQPNLFAGFRKFIDDHLVPNKGLPPVKTPEFPRLTASQILRMAAQSLCMTEEGALEHFQIGEMDKAAMPEYLTVLADYIDQVRPTIYPDLGGLPKVTIVSAMKQFLDQSEKEGVEMPLPESPNPTSYSNQATKNMEEHEKSKNVGFTYKAPQPDPMRLSYVLEAIEFAVKHRNTPVHARPKFKTGEGGTQDDEEDDKKDEGELTEEEKRTREAEEARCKMFSEWGLPDAMDVQGKKTPPMEEFLKKMVDVAKDKMYFDKKIKFKLPTETKMVSLMKRVNVSMCSMPDMPSMSFPDMPDMPDFSGPGLPNMPKLPGVNLPSLPKVNLPSGPSVMPTKPKEWQMWIIPLAGKECEKKQPKLWAKMCAYAIYAGAQMQRSPFGTWTPTEQSKIKLPDHFSAKGYNASGKGGADRSGAATEFEGGKGDDSD